MVELGLQQGVADLTRSAGGQPIAFAAATIDPFIRMCRSRPEQHLYVEASRRGNRPADSHPERNGTTVS